MVLAVIAAAAVLLRKRHTVPGTPVRPAGVYMRLELVQGTLADGGAQQALELRNELFIGANLACEIAVQGEGVAPKHVRLFLMEGAVYAESLCVPAGVNGTEMQSVQRLRSGDEMTIGNVVLRLKF